jgi:hypothetical protein
MNDVRALEAYFTHIDSRLSRTVTSGRADVSVSSIKRAPVLSGEQLALRLAANRARVSEYIVGRLLRPPLVSGEFVACLLTIGELYSSGVFPSSLFRMWPYTVKGGPSVTPVDAARVHDGLVALDTRVIEALTDGLGLSRIGAEVEWEIGIGPIHPFYDACGRIGRYGASLVRLWAGQVLPEYDSRDEYMARAALGIEAFVVYAESVARYDWFPSACRSVVR